MELERDINGRVRKLLGPKREITLFREPAGWIRGIQSDDWRVDIQRDVNGWPTVWSGVDGDEEVQRDAGGRIVVDDKGTRVLRDSRGEVVRITLGKVGEWRMMRDATGRTLSVRAPGGATVGMDRDAVGRPKWFRFPDGSMLRRQYDGAVIGDVLVDPNGHTVGQQQWRFDVDGRVMEHIDVNGQIWRYHRDDMGRLEVLEADNGQTWIWDAQTATSPDGHVLVRDDAGRMMETQLGTGPKAWDLATDLMSIHRDEQGELAGIGGDDGLTTVQLDALGRLTGFGRRRVVRGNEVRCPRPTAHDCPARWHPKSPAMGTRCRPTRWIGGPVGDGAGFRSAVGLWWARYGIAAGQHGARIGVVGPHGNTVVDSGWVRWQCAFFFRPWVFSKPLRMWWGSGSSCSGSQADPFSGACLRSIRSRRPSGRGSRLALGGAGPG